MTPSPKTILLALLAALLTACGGGKVTVYPVYVNGNVQNLSEDEISARLGKGELADTSILIADGKPVVFRDHPAMKTLLQKAKTDRAAAATAAAGPALSTEEKQAEAIRLYRDAGYITSTHGERNPEKVALLRRALSLEPNFVEAQYSLANVHFNMASSAAADDQKGPALAEFQNGLTALRLAKILCDRKSFLIYKDPGDAVQESMVSEIPDQLNRKEEISRRTGDDLYEGIKYGG